MSDRATITIDGPDDRNKAHHWINRAPKGWRVEFKGPQRTTEQSARMWAMLDDIVAQHLFNGRRYTSDEAKVVFMQACGKEASVLPTLDGKGFVSYGQSSSDLSIPEMSDLIEFMFAWGAENSIAWKDPKEAALRELEARSRQTEPA